MSEITTTPFSSKCEILGELWLKYRADYPDLEDFIEYNDLGLPIAYAIANDIVKPLDIVDVAEMERENADVRNHHNPLF